MSKKGKSVQMLFLVLLVAETVGRRVLEGEPASIHKSAVMIFLFLIAILLAQIAFPAEESGA